jgi:lysozyme
MDKYIMKTSKAGRAFIKSFESFVPYVYDDLRPAVNGKYRRYSPGERIVGTLTVLYGHTDAARHPLRIKDCIGKTFSEAFADEVLAVDLDECEEYVNKAVKVPITQGQFDALVSFTFNCGAGNAKNIIARLNRGDYKGARAAFDLYVRSKGTVMRGLQRRRDGEQALWDSNAPALPDEIVEHPEQVDSPRKTAREAIKDSPSLRLQINALVTSLCLAFWTAWDWVMSLGGWLMSWLPGAASEVGTTVGAVRTIAEPAGLAIPAALLGAVAMSCLLVLFARQLTQKMEG